MRFETGREIEFAKHRLNDIVFFCEKTQPVDGDWESYAKQAMNMIASQARDAMSALRIREITLPLARPTAKP